MAPSVPPLPSGQTRRNSALMTAATLHAARSKCSARVRARTLSSGLDERPVRQLWSQIAQFVGSASSGKCRDERRVVRVGALARVVARGGVVDQERPVGALQREQLAQRARATGRRRAPRSSALRCVQASSPRLQVRRSRPAPQLVGGDVAGAGVGVVDRRAARPSAELAAPPRRNVTPSCQWWPKSSVSNATTPGRRAARRTLARAARARAAPRSGS